MAGTDNTLKIKLDKDTTLPLLENLGKSAYAIAVAHGFQGTEQDWLNSLRGSQGPQGNPGPIGEPFKFSDFTQEQLNALKGPKGDSISGATAVKSYDVIWGIARAGERGNGRGYLEYSPLSGFGKLHLDIVLTQNSGNGGVIATLPANAPVPSRLLEVAVDANNNSVYIEPNSRNIKAWGVPSGKRYIFDIIGFWKEI